MTFDPGRIADPDLRTLYDYWASKCHGRLAPARRDIDPAEMKPLLPHVMLVDVLNDPLDFRIRLTGTEIVSRFGEELTGRMLRSIDLDGEVHHIFDRYAAVAKTGEPQVDAEEFIRNDGRYMHYHRLLLPLSSDGARIDMLLVGHKAIGADGQPASDIRRL